MNIEQLYPFFQQSTGISTDSSKIAPGNLFLALNGDNFDGNDFAHEALDKGCSYAIVDNRKYVSNKQCLYVENCLKPFRPLLLIIGKSWAFQFWPSPERMVKQQRKNYIRCLKTKIFHHPYTG